MFSNRRSHYQFMAGIGVFLLTMCMLSFKVRAEEKIVMNTTQNYIGGESSIASLIKEECVNDLQGVKSIKLDIANSEVHYHCPKCGGPSSATQTTVTVYGYTIGDESEEELAKYTVSGADGKIPRTASNLFTLSNEIRSKYLYLKIVASFSGTYSDRCGCNEKNSGFYSNGTGYVKATANLYDSPVIQYNGDLSNKSMIEGISDYIGDIAAYFPGGAESFDWQYYDGGKWNSLVKGKDEYTTVSYGKLQLSDKKGGTDFGKSNSVKLINPQIVASGIKFRVVLKAMSGAEDSISSEAVISVKSRDISGIQSVVYAGKYGEAGEKIRLEDVYTFVNFNNGQIMDMSRLCSSDDRVKYFGFIKIDSKYKDKTDDFIISGLTKNEITYSEVGQGSESLKIENGSNRFFIKITYYGTVSKNVYGVVSVEGKDAVPPSFNENVNLYESDGLTLYTGNDYEISDADATRKLRIIGTIADSYNNSDISWAYTLTDTKLSSAEIKIPVFRKGNQIDITAGVNGTYTLYAEDLAGNKTSKIIKVRAYDENNPVLSVNLKGNGSGNIHNGYKIEAVGSDAEKLASKAYLYKRFNTRREAEAYNPALAAESDFIYENIKNVTQKGFYLVAVRDAVGKVAFEIIEIPKVGEVIDTVRPEIFVSPVAIKDLSGEMSEWNIRILDNYLIKNYSIQNESGEALLNQNHSHGSECTESGCTLAYHFVPENTGRYLVTASDYAGNTTSVYITATIRSIESIEITGLADTLSVNSQISLEELVKGNRVLLKMSDGTTDIYKEKTGLKLECRDKNGKIADKVVIGYGENRITFTLSVKPSSGDERKYEYSKTIIGEDNVAPLPGRLESRYSDGWNGTLTNNLNNQVTLLAKDFTDDGSLTDKLIITWYRDDTEIQKKSAGDKGDILGPFSGEDCNGTYRYTVTDENGNFCNSTSVKVIDCWDTTPPTGEIRLMPEGVTNDSKARYKQIQIINAEDNRGLAEKPFSFKGDVEASYGIIGSVVAGENAEYDVYLKDMVGNTAFLGNLKLTGIDSVAPTINKNEMTNTDDGKVELHIDATDTDSEGNDKSSLLEYSLDGQNYQSSPDFTVSESGVYTIYVRDDTGNITKTCTDYADTEKPCVSARQDESGAGVIIVEASDNAGLSRIIMEGPDGLREILQVYDGLASDTVTKEIGRTGNYRIIAFDMAGNTEETTIEISFIRTACNPSILSGLDITPKGWTSGDVTVIAQLSDTTNLSSNPFRWNGSVSTARPYVVISENGKASVEIYDKYGNMITSDSVTVSNIDRTAPVLDELKQSEDKNHLIINVSDAGSGVAQITVSGGPYTVETGAVTLNGENSPEEIQITLPTNGTYTVRAYDIAGNSSQRQLTVSGVTTDIPKVIKEEVVVTEEKVITRDRVITETIRVPEPVLVPVPTVEYVTQYKYLKEKGLDTSTLLKGDTEYISKTDTISDKTTETKETVVNEKSDAQNSEYGFAGEITEDGTYIAPDGYEYFNRVDPNLKKDHPFKYWFRKNAETIAAVACILVIILLITCIIMGIMLIRDYLSENKDKQTIKRISKNK